MRFDDISLAAASPFGHGNIIVVVLEAARPNLHRWRLAIYRLALNLVVVCTLIVAIAR